METEKNSYQQAVEGCEQFGILLKGLVQELLVQAGIQYHSISYRVKSEESAFRKLISSPDKYAGFDDFTDLLGVRVITYFPNDVDKVAQVLTKQFRIDNKNSIDKRKILGIDQFGYLSLHYIASLNTERRKLPEYSRFENIRFELQIRSILQHSWAEIYHDLGYKFEESLPINMQRSFSRLAGLLEFADEEFERIRTDLTSYSRHAQSVIKTSPKQLKIDQSTVTAALASEKILIELDIAVAGAINVPLKETIDPTYAGREVKDLKILGISNLDELLKSAEKYKEYATKFAEYWVRPDSPAIKRGEPFPRGIGLFYLGYVLASISGIEGLETWRKQLRNRASLLQRMNKTWERVVNELGKPSF